jgi:hypothetical protein
LEQAIQQFLNNIRKPAFDPVIFACLPQHFVAAIVQVHHRHRSKGLPTQALADTSTICCRAATCMFLRVGWFVVIVLSMRLQRSIVPHRHHFRQQSNVLAQFCPNICIHRPFGFIDYPIRASAACCTPVRASANGIMTEAALSRLHFMESAEKHSNYSYAD